VPIRAEARAAVLARLGIDRPFLLHVSGEHPRKNLPFLLRCFRTLAARGHDHPLLVLAGPTSHAYVDAACRAAGLDAATRERVRHLGPVSDDDLRACLQSCAVFVFPSLYEGFGLPGLEALASRGPVGSSNRSTVPEVVGDAGLLVYPEDHGGWVDAIDSVLTAPAHAADLATRGRARAQRFGWDTSATRLLALLGVTLS